MVQWKKTMRCIWVSSVLAASMVLCMPAAVFAEDSDAVTVETGMAENMDEVAADSSLVDPVASVENSGGIDENTDAEQATEDSVDEDATETENTIVEDSTTENVSTDVDSSSTGNHEEEILSDQTTAADTCGLAGTEDSSDEESEEIQTGWINGAYYLEDGTLANGVIQNQRSNGVLINASDSADTLYIFKNGVRDSSETGIYSIDGTRIYFNKGTCNRRVSTLVYNPSDDSWYYVEKNVINASFTDLVYYYGTWYYVQNGKLNWNFTDVVYHAGTWYYVQNGRLNWNYTGLVNHAGSWFYVQNGKINWKFTDLVYHFGSWYYVQKGKLNWNMTDVVYHAGSWYYVENGKLNWNYTNLFYHAGSWFYVQNGMINWNYTNLVKYNGTWYYVENGKINWKFNGLFKFGETWYYIDGGKLNRNYTHLTYHYGTWYYVENGVLNWNGVHVASPADSDTLYYVNNGKLDRSFSGQKYIDGRQYEISNGVVTKAFSDLESRYCRIAYNNGISSATNWLIIVDTQQNYVSVFRGSQWNWTLDRMFRCSSGASSSPTVKGYFTVGSRGLGFGHGYTCWYYTQFYGNYLFHSVLYNQGSMSSIKDGRLGYNISAGCVRLDISNAKWIYDTIPSGTKVYVF